jgi:hypothetical protein
LRERLNSVDPASTTAADCDRQVARAASLNAPDLLYGASVCFAAHMPVEGNFLLNAGQVRSIADLTLMVPATRADSDVQISLYSIIYFQAGGPGSEEVFREAPLRDRFFWLFDSWSPAYAADYDPGWNVRRRPGAADYQAAVAESRTGRRRQLTDVATLYSDETYYSLHRRFLDLQTRNPRGFVEGTPDADLSRDLERGMNERSAALGIETYPADADAADPFSARVPPAAPEPGEVVLSGSADPAIRHCADIAERLTIATDSRIVRVLVTRSPDWGTIWRADIAGADQTVERFTCTSHATSSRPLVMGDENIPPLPEGGAPPAGPE